MNRFYEQKTKELIFPVEGAPFQICHASNICLLKNGDLLAAWFAGEREGSDDVSIWTCRRRGGRWGRPELTAHDTFEPHWNPVLFERRDGVLFLFYKVGRRIAQWRTMYKCSRDGGKTFSEAKELVPVDRGGRGPVRCKITELSDGSLIAGASTEKGIWTAYADRSSDGGKTWALSAPIRIPLSAKTEKVQSDIPLSAQSFEGRGVIQPTIWESEPGLVHMLLRSSEGKIFRSDSPDFGKSWGLPYATELPNNNSGIDVAKADDGLLILCLNPVAVNFGARTPIVLMASRDNGRSWRQETVLEDRAGAVPGGTAEYSYPSVIAAGEELYVSYTFNRKSIAFHHFRRKKQTG